MSVHKAEFFEQATEHLLSSLDLQEGLGQLLSYLSTVLPCREIRLATYFMQEQGSAKNLHLLASLSGTSRYYGPLLNKGRLDEMISLKNRAPGNAVLFALDVSGRRLKTIPFTEQNGVISFSADNDSGKDSPLAYELIRNGTPSAGP